MVYRCTSSTLKYSTCNGRVTATAMTRIAAASRMSLRTGRACRGKVQADRKQTNRQRKREDIRAAGAQRVDLQCARGDECGVEAQNDESQEPGGATRQQPDEARARNGKGQENVTGFVSSP